MMERDYGKLSQIARGVYYRNTDTGAIWLRGSPRFNRMNVYRVMPAHGVSLLPCLEEKGTFMTNESSPVKKHNNKWRVVDIVVAAIIAVASGVIFWGWDIVCTAPLAIVGAVTPGFEGLLNAFWLFAGPLAAIIVRRPGAALFAEILAAALELTLGNQWGAGGTLLIGILQGLGAEIGFAVFSYKKWDWLSTTVSGALSGIACAVYSWVTNPAWDALRISVYVVTSAIGGAIVSGVVMYLLQRAIAQTGALDRFESGRTQTLV